MSQEHTRLDMPYSLFDHPHFKALLAREDLAALFSADAEIEAMLRFEAALASAEAEAGVIPKAASTAIDEATSAFRADDAELSAGVKRDGLLVPALIKALRNSLAKAHRPHLHVGATSQDVIDTGLMLRLKQAFALLRDDIERVVSQLDALATASGDQPLMARTRMQRALPIRLGDRIQTWKAPLEQHLTALEGFYHHVFAVQFAGPVGTLETLGDKGPDVRKRLAEKLGLADPGGSWHTDRSRIADIASWLTKVSASLGKIGQDIVLMAQNEIGEAVIEGAGLSSAMAHKRNPVPAELLITLARYNAGELATINQAFIHENERSGTAWTLEWLTLPAMVAASGAALRIASDLLDTVTFPRPSDQALQQ